MALRLNRYVVVALPRHFAQLGQSGDDPGAIPNVSGLDAGHEPIGDLLLDIGPRHQRQRPRLHQPRPRRIVRPRPAESEIEPVPPRPECVGPAGRRDVERPTSSQVDASGEHVNVHRPICVPVLDGAPGVPIRIQASPGGPLELVQGLVDLLSRRLVVQVPSDHA